MPYSACNNKSHCYLLQLSLSINPHQKRHAKTYKKSVKNEYKKVIINQSKIRK